MKRTHIAIVTITLLVCGIASANPVVEGFGGLDQNGDLSCAPEEMGFALTAGDAGGVFSADVFFDMIAGPVRSFGCVFCVQEKALVTGETFVYGTPAAWSTIPMVDSDDVAFPFLVSAWIPATFPNYRCYGVQATDFGGSSPMTAPFVLGTFTFTYAAADDGCVGFLIDGPNSSWLTAGFTQGTLDLEEQVCPPFDCSGISSTEEGSWGGVKSLFR